MSRLPPPDDNRPPSNPAWQLAFGFGFGDANPFSAESCGELFGWMVRGARQAFSDGVYRCAFRQRSTLFQQTGFTQRAFDTVLTVQPGAGDAHVLGTSINVHPLYGAPVIHGAALKGLCKAFALSWPHEDGRPLVAARSDDEVRLFGAIDSLGEVTFEDAWWDPASQIGPFELDVVTPHEATYHSSRGQTMPSLKDKVTPAPRLVACGRFVVWVGPRRTNRDWVVPALELLTLALKHLGVGARVNIDQYGRLTAV